MLTRLLALAALVATAGCSLTAPGSAETDRIATTVADAISWPRQDSADGYLRAALATRAGQDGRLVVLEAAPLDASAPEDPLARLVLRVHVEGTEQGWVTTDPVTACYDADFSRYGVVDQPSRRECPDREPLVPAPLAPQPRRALPGTAEDVVARALRRPDAEAVRIAVLDRLPAPGTDEVTGLADLPPDLLVEQRGGDVGVSLSADGPSCVLGARVGGVTTVWRPSRVHLQPGELGCDPSAALYGPVPPPH